MLIREKTESDTDSCVALLLAVHRVDGYPRFLPAKVLDFISPGYESSSWVAEKDGEVVGHVALHVAAVDPTLLAAQRATGLPPEGLAVLARLLVAPNARRAGLGRELLDLATSHARSRGQRAVLDVVQSAHAPIALYEAAGWTRIEPLRLKVSEMTALDLWVYLSPDMDAG